MASIVRRPDGRWRARYRDAAGREHSRHFPRKVDAQAWLDTVTTSVPTGSYIDPDRARVTVGALAQTWLAGKVNLKPTTRARYEGVLAAHVLPRWANVPLIHVEHGDVQSWLAELSAVGQSGASVRKAHGVLSGILGLAVRDRRLPTNPAAGVDLPPLGQRRRRYLSARKVDELADAAGDGPAAVLVLAYCGLRWSEFAALRVRHMDLMRRRIDVSEAVTEVNGSRLVWGTPKSHERRSVPIPRFLVDELAFPGARGGVLRNRTARRAWFDQAAAAIGEPGLTPHELRLTAASLAEVPTSRPCSGCSATPAPL